ncbi:MAG: hypothetical protein CBD61_01465 [Pelagibacteraceae bacterium TMED201]|nr:hypothetical protein [Pelagibacterales bacterium SAG-MED30]OUW63863.1 MAG: hypothetical protein CBD61_01465 [Pelagibacteraceae bacterium TMED201]|tara:strand:- start:5869 stop:6258 length:390 start_codon:yes stop_codon:yes gene_type:complete
MKKISLFTKFTFHFSNVTLLILYLYPGSIFGWIIYGDFEKQPSITPDFVVSSNHFYAFLVLTILGIFSFEKNKIKILFIYLFSISIILEICHGVIPNRSFQYSDLFGNFLGVLLVFLVFNFNQYFKNQK